MLECEAISLTQLARHIGGSVTETEDVFIRGLGVLSRASPTVRRRQTRIL